MFSFYIFVTPFMFLYDFFFIFFYIALIILYIQVLLFIFYKSVLDFNHIKEIILHTSTYFLSLLFCFYFILFLYYLFNNFITDTLDVMDSSLTTLDKEIDSFRILDITDPFNNTSKKKIVTPVDYEFKNEESNPSDEDEWDYDVFIFTVFTFFLSFYLLSD